MADSYFKVVIRDPKWDVRTEAKQLGFLYQLFIDSKKPQEVFIRYKSTKEAIRAREVLAKNENVLRVESMDEWNIRPKKKPENQQPETNGAASIEATNTTTEPKTATKRNAAAASKNNMPLPIPMQMQMQLPIPMPMGPGMATVCAACRNNGASFQCFVCGIFYCGEQCQRADWPAHIMQCMPRLVRATNAFVPNIPQMIAPMGAFHGMHEEPGRWNNSMENVQQRQSVHRNEPVAGSSKQSAKGQNTGALPKVPPACNVPTNVLKSMAVKRHQEQAVPSTSSETGTPNAQPPNEAKPAKDGSKLIKRMQQKTAPKRTIQYATFPLEGENVKISYVADSHLYVYRAGLEENGQSNRYIEFVKRSIECARKVTEFIRSPPKVEDVLFAPFDGDYYRAIVRSVEGAQVSVFFPDFGNTQTVEWNELKIIPDKDIQYGTCYTHAVTIEGVAAFSPMVRQFLTELQEQDEFELTKVNDGTDGKTVDMRHVRELYQMSDKVQEVAQMEKLVQGAAALAVKEDAAPKVAVPDPSSYIPVTADDIISHEMPMDQEVQLMIVEASELLDSNQLTVILKSDSIAFAKMLNECEQYGAADPNPYQPESESVVFLVHFEGIWCRALVAGMEEEMQYYLLDLGILRTLPGKPDCRRYPAGLTRQMFTSECIVENPEMLRVEGSKEDINVALRGKLLQATAHQRTEEESEATYIKIHSMSG
uniref:MYND-type domain-containing protein n=1 Tax=Anopheles epiroticus TaxID=199890 RepID=A0A182PIY6_9DIPT